MIQTVTGGGFGGKEDYPSVIAGHAALLAWKSGRPVKLVYDRLEDIAATTKRHPALVRVRTGHRRDGTLTATDVDVRHGRRRLRDALAGGALARRAARRRAPTAARTCRSARRAVATNTPPNGAFRGFGAPQTVFAIESHMDRVAARARARPARAAAAQRGA